VQDVLVCGVGGVVRMAHGTHWRASPAGLTAWQVAETFYSFTAHIAHDARVLTLGLLNLTRNIDKFLQI